LFSLLACIVDDVMIHVLSVGLMYMELLIFFFSSRRRHTRCYRDWSSDVCSSDLLTALSSGQEVSHSLRRGRHAWVQIARGSVKLNGQLLEQGDAASVSGEEALKLTGVDEAEALVFDLA